MKEDAPIKDDNTSEKAAQQVLGSEPASNDNEANTPPSPAERQQPKDDSDAESVGGQRNTMSRKRMLLAFSALSVCLFVSFIDQTSVSTAVPAIAGDLDTGTATSWIGTSFLIASTAFQLINGRLSDIFGRKNLLMICLVLMAVGDILCGFAKTKEQLFAFRAVAGIGGGGINSIVMIIVSDITTLENRGKYQGVLGAVIALANGVGPFVGGAVVEEATWRWVFWMVPIICAPAAVTILFCLPLKHQSGNYADKVKKIDYGGIALNMASTLLVLVPLSGGGVSYPWSSPFVIAAVTVGAVLGVLFVLYEWKLARLPIMPLRLFQAPHCSYLYGQTFLMGQAYFGNLFYLPIYFQSVLKFSPLAAGAMILPVVIATSVMSILSGQYMLWLGRYMPCILVGFFLWTLGNGLTILFDRDTGLGELIGILIIVGAGIGLTLQPTLVGMYANSRSEDRAVTTGLRNFIRTIGGAFGLVVSGVILSNTLRRDLQGRGFISDGVIAELTSSTYTLGQKGFSDEEQAVILRAYMRGLHYIFIYYVVCTGLSLALTLGVGNTGLKAKKPAQAEEASEVASEPPAETLGNGNEKRDGSS
ncbi:major facilitator superfamily transporter [Colletotrichum graminicola]|uniref:Major facilitator superfamily transporter n=1 Tax=Colletotrichum graminicola (strain M1.001 / M2 / FGSC 10212) TaxID=645133 RepID=E3Q9G9_COLGM|nr:major facilitator superfamily transporter [Colletotrichum graminicola M1.001]EFQ27348.1 major facilitator superfamily transporter [Colletotrichum graminicola M1.001]WDK13140.1 major facilitator superfamily transporter [Colletotrichum graminicola]